MHKIAPVDGTGIFHTIKIERSYIIPHVKGFPEKLSEMTSGKYQQLVSGKNAKSFRKFFHIQYQYQKSGIIPIFGEKVIKVNFKKKNKSKKIPKRLSNRGLQYNYRTKNSNHLLFASN